jgi:Tfp pilus assembly protein PilF
MNAFLESRRQYAIGARSLGLDERYPEAEMNQLGYAALQAFKNPPLAVWVFRQNADAYPESANVYDSLGDGLLAMGDTTAAMTQFRRAIDIGTRTKHRVVEESQKKLKALEESRAKPKGK